MGNNESGTAIGPSRSNTQTTINVRSADESVEMAAMPSDRPFNRSPSLVFADRAWDGYDGGGFEGGGGDLEVNRAPSATSFFERSPSATSFTDRVPSAASNRMPVNADKIEAKAQANNKLKRFNAKIHEKLGQVKDYIEKRSNSILSNTASAKDVILDDTDRRDSGAGASGGLNLDALDQEYQDRRKDQKFNVLDNFFERMGTNVSMDRVSSPDSRPGSSQDGREHKRAFKKMKPGMFPDLHQAPSMDEKKMRPSEYENNADKNKIALSHLDKKLPVMQFGTMKFNKKCVYSHSHCFYTKDESVLQDVPPPHPPYTRKSEIFENLQYRKVDRKALKVPKTYLNGLLWDLVHQLTGKYKDDMSKLRAIYVWITSQNMLKIKLPLKPAKEGYVFHYLEKIKKKKGNYAQLFGHMCNLAGLPCVVIHGYLKGSTYEIGQPLSKDLHYGEWNAVLVNNNWRFINAYWGACAVGSEVGTEITTYRLDENFFIPDPEQLAYTHFPEEQKWQLMEPPMSMFNFEKRAFLKERFFELEMRVLSHPECDIKVKNGETEILFGMNRERVPFLKFMCLVYMKEEKDYVLLYDDENRFQQDFLYRPNEDSLGLKIRFPKRGTYRVEIVGKDTSVKDENYEFDWIAIYKASVQSGPKKYAAFPKCAEMGWGNSALLKDVGLIPFGDQEKAVVTANEGVCNIQFDIASPEAEELNLSYKMISVSSGLDEVILEENAFTREGGTMQVIINIPPGDEGAFCLFANVDDDTYGSVQKNLCNYLVISTPLRELTKTEKKEIKEVEDYLSDAIHFKQLEMLERAVDLVETRRMERHMYAKLEEAKESIERLKNIAKMMHKVLALDQRTISEIRAYTNPTPEIHAVMKATLLLLGHYEEETREWKNVQAIIGKTGRSSLKRKINMFDINHCKLDIALGAQKLLGDMKLEDIVNQSRGAATFYEWIHYIGEEVSHRRKDELMNAVPLVTLAAVRWKAQTKNHKKVKEQALAELEAAAYVKQESRPDQPPSYDSSLPQVNPVFQDIEEEDNEPDLPSPFSKQTISLLKMKKAEAATKGKVKPKIKEEVKIEIEKETVTEVEDEPPVYESHDMTDIPEEPQGTDNNPSVFAEALANLPDSSSDLPGSGVDGLPGGDYNPMSMWLNQNYGTSGV